MAEGETCVLTPPSKTLSMSSFQGDISVKNKFPKVDKVAQDTTI